MDMQIIPPELFKQMVDNHPEPPLDCENSMIRGAHLAGIWVEWAFFVNCRFEDCVFIDCGFHEVQLRECEFKNCIFKESSWKDSIFDSCRFTKTTFKDCQLMKVMFSEVDASYTNFTGCNFSWAYIHESDFREVNFTDAILNETRLERSKLYNSQKCVFADIWPRQVEDIDLSEFGDNSELTSDADALVIHLTKEPRMRLGYSLGLPEGSWFGMCVELAIEFKDGVTEEELQEAKNVLSSNLEFFRGDEHRGLIFLPNHIPTSLRYVAIKTLFVREKTGTKKTWLVACMPNGWLNGKDFCDKYGEMDTSLPAASRLYHWLAQIGAAVYRKVPFDLAIIGEEVSGRFYAAEMREKENSLNVFGLAFLLSRPNGKLIYYPSLLQLGEEDDDEDDEEDIDDDLFD